jgi:hypothetical protein
MRSIWVCRSSRWFRGRVTVLTVTCEGYVQGMSDLCAPLYVVAGSDEPLTFWCFVEVMNRMVCNDTRDLLERDQRSVHFSRYRISFVTKVG